MEAQGDLGSRLVTPFRVFLTLLITCLLSPLDLEVRLLKSLKVEARQLEHHYPHAQGKTEGILALFIPCSNFLGFTIGFRACLEVQGT